jgi:AcrR family transcriptional regulator
MHQATGPLRPAAGRPTREQAELRHAELLDRALELFLENGFELVTMEAIAAAVGMTKRTVYARYEDKAALFRAVVQRAVERWILPVETLQAVETDDLEATLVGIARIRLDNAISPVGVRLDRIINAESFRFPEIFALAYEEGSRPTIRFIADLLRRRLAPGSPALADPEIAATAFLSMVVGGPRRRILGGGTMEPQDVDCRIRFCVRLFLDGARPR